MKKKWKDMGPQAKRHSDPARFKKEQAVNEVVESDEVEEWTSRRKRRQARRAARKEE